MTTSPPDESNAIMDTPVISGGTVRAWNPMLPRPEQAPIPVDVHEIDPEEVESIDMELLEEEAVEAEPVLIESLGDVPVSRPNAPTIPEEAVPLPSVPDAGRDEPPAVAGEVSVVEPEPFGMFDPRPRPALRPSTEPAQQASPTRADPPAVVGEVSISMVVSQAPPPSEARVKTSPQTVVSLEAMNPSGSQPILIADGMTASGSQPMMTASGSQPMMTPEPMTASGAQPVMTMTPSDPGNYIGGVYSETTGPQPVAQAEITVPQPVMRSGKMLVRPDRTLWYVALALVLLAVGGVLLVVSRAA